MNNSITTSDTPNVLVIGAFSFLGAHLIYQLVEKGYHVKGTYRDGPEINNYKDQLKLLVQQFTGSVEFFAANTLFDDNWSAIFEGVEYVHLVAFPHAHTSETERVLMGPSLEGTRRILQFCQRITSVKRLVMTSCYGALTDAFNPTKTYSEEDWYNTDEMTVNGFSYAKACAEELAYTFCSGLGCHFQLVTLVPGVMLGPPLCKLFNYYQLSIKFFHTFHLDGVVI